MKSELPTHTCAHCGHTWNSLEKETAQHIIKAAEVNKTGPFCALCHHLEMADRYAVARGIPSLREAVSQWERNRIRATERRQEATALRLIQFVAARYNFSVSQLQSGSRHSRYTWPRFLAIYLCRNLVNLSYERLAVLFKRTPNACLHSCRSVVTWVTTNQHIADDFLPVWHEAKHLLSSPASTIPPFHHSGPLCPHPFKVQGSTVQGSEFVPSSRLPTFALNPSVA